MTLVQPILDQVEDRRLSLAFAYAASEAYEHADENRELIAEVVRDLRSRVEIGDAEFAELVSRLFDVLETNRTAPAVVRLMAFADAARVSRAEAVGASHRWLARRCWRRESARAARDLAQQVAATLDALLAEPH